MRQLLRLSTLRPNKSQSLLSMQKSDRLCYIVCVQLMKTGESWREGESLSNYCNDDVAMETCGLL